MELINCLFPCCVIGLICLFILLVVIIPIPLWIAARLSDVKIGWGALLGMTMKKIPVDLIINSTKLKLFSSIIEPVSKNIIIIIFMNFSLFSLLTFLS